MAVPLTASTPLQCSFGSSPVPLSVLPIGKPIAKGMAMAAMTDMAPMVSIATFGTCNSMANPLVATATALAQGVLTPAPCIPVTAAPWFLAARSVMVGGVPAVPNSAKCTCTYGGVISINALPSNVQIGS